MQKKQQMSIEELKKEREKEALPKRLAYMNSKNDDKKTAEKKIRREHQKFKKLQKMNNDELLEIRQKEASRKRKAYNTSQKQKNKKPREKKILSKCKK